MSKTTITAATLKPHQVGILALLWEVHDRQIGPVSNRIKATDIGRALGLEPNGWSPQIGPLVDEGLCDALKREVGQSKKKTYYVITDKGKEALNQFLAREYKLPDEVYSATRKERALEALKVIKERVKSRMREISALGISAD